MEILRSTNWGLEWVNISFEKNIINNSVDNSRVYSKDFSICKRLIAISFGNALIIIMPFKIIKNHLEKGYLVFVINYGKVNKSAYKWKCK